MGNEYIMHSNMGGQYVITTNGESELDVMHASKPRGLYEREAMEAISTRSDYAKKRQENADRIKAAAREKNAEVAQRKKDLDYNKIRLTGTVRKLAKMLDNYTVSDSVAAKLTDKTEIGMELKIDGKSVASWEYNLDGTRL